VIIQLSFDIPDGNPFDTETFYKDLEKFISDYGDLTIDEWEVINEEDS